MNCDCGALDCPNCNFHMNRRRYELPYEDPGQRRPWVPYHEYVARREAERLRVPGVFREDRARRAADVRAGVRFPRDARFQQERFRRIGAQQVLPMEERAERYREQVRARKDEWRAMHRRAKQIYAEEVEDPEGAFDEDFGHYGGRYEEFLGHQDADDVANLPVLDPKKVNFDE